MPDTLETSQHFIFVCVILHSFKYLYQGLLQDTSVLLLCVPFLVWYYYGPTIEFTPLIFRSNV